MANFPPKVRDRMAWIHRLLITPPEESKLNHFQKEMLEHEFEELQLQEEVNCSPSTKPNSCAQ